MYSHPMDKKRNETDTENYEIILSTAWYKMKSKFNTEIYETWIDHFLNHCKNAKLVVYTNNESESVLDKYMDNKNNYKNQNQSEKNILCTCKQ